jgi:hypothetical protein
MRAIDARHRTTICCVHDDRAHHARPLHAMTRVADNWLLHCARCGAGARSDADRLTHAEQCDGARTLAVPDVTDHSNPAWIDTERAP